MYYFSKNNPAPKDIEYTLIETLEALGPRFCLSETGYQGALTRLAELGKAIVGDAIAADADEDDRMLGNVGDQVCWELIPGECRIV